MKRGYVRPMTTLDAASQMAAIVKAGATEDTTWVEELTKGQIRKTLPEVIKARPQAIRQLRKGDLFVIANIVVLALDRGDFIETMRAVTAQGAKVFDAEAGAIIDWPPEADVAMAALERFERAKRLAQTANARKGAERARTLTGKLKGRLKVLREADKLAARDDWTTPGMTAAEVAEKYGVSTRTLYNEFGGRFTGPPRRKRMATKPAAPAKKGKAKR